MGCMMHEGNEVQYGNLNCMKILVCVHALCVLSVCVCVLCLYWCVLCMYCVLLCVHVHVCVSELVRQHVFCCV